MTQINNTQSIIKTNVQNQLGKINKLKIVHWNANSISNKKEELKIFLKNQNVDICVVSETKLGKNSIFDFSDFEKDYNILIKFRQNKGGAGGIAVFIKNKLSYSEIKDYDSYNVEQISFKLFHQRKEYFIMGIYNPPDQLLCSKLIKEIDKNYTNYIITGDLNSKSSSIGCKTTNKNGKILENLLMKTDIQILNNFDYTFHRLNSDYKEILDLFLCSSTLKPFTTNYEVLYEQDMTTIQSK
jgi:exonuclease III